MAKLIFGAFLAILAAGSVVAAQQPASTTRTEQVLSTDGPPF